MDSKEQDKNINSSENSHIEVDNAAGTVTTTQSRNWIWVLVIIALLIVLGIFGYVGSQALFSVVFWILLILLLVIACIVYIIVFLAVRGHKKTALITFIVAVALFFLSIPTLGYILVFAGFYDVASQIQDETLDEDYDGELAYEYMNKENEQYRSFSLEEIQQMKKEKLDIDSFIAKYGKATKALDYDSFMTLYYDSGEDNWKRTIHITLDKNSEGEYVFESVDGGVEAKGIMIDEGDNSRSDWSIEQYNSLVLGDYKTGKGGTKWSEIKKDHPSPQAADIVFREYDEQPEYQLEIEYTPFITEEPYVKGVFLKFAPTEEGKDFRLIEKSIKE